MSKYSMVWACALLAAAGATALGGPINFKEVPADAKWLAHYDGEAARESKVMTAFIKEFVSKGKHDAASDTSHTRPWCCAALEKIDGITLYGRRIGERDGVAVVRGKIDKEELIGKLKGKAGAKPSGEGDKAVWTWTRCKGTKSEHQVALAFPKEGLLVLAASEKQLHAAIGLVNGKGEALGAKSSALTADMPKAAILFARAAELTKEDVGPKFKPFRNIKGFEYFAREDSGRWHESLHVTAQSKKAADAVQLIVAGMKAMAELAFADHADVVKLIEEGKIKREGNAVSVAFEGDAEKLAKLVPEMAEDLRGQWMVRLSVYRSYTGDNQPQAEERKDEAKGDRKGRKEEK